MNQDLMNEDLYNIIPSKYNLIKILTEMSSQVGNNLYPGKYGDFELYVMGLITIDELEKRRMQTYKDALDKKYITQEEYNSRINTKELVQSYINVCKYKNKPYFLGIPLKYTKKRLELLWGNVVKNSLNYIKKFKQTDNTYLFNLLNIIYTPYTDLNKITDVSDSEAILTRFTEKRSYDPAKLSNLYSATEGKAQCSFTYSLRSDFIPVLTKQNLEIINNNSTQLITYFTDEWLKNIHISFNNAVKSKYTTFKETGYIVNSSELIGICQNKNKNLIFFVMSESYYNKITSKDFSSPIGNDYVNKNLLMYILENIFNLDNTNLINLISNPPDPNGRFEFIDNDDRVLKTRGCIKFPYVSSIERGPYLHEFMHQFVYKNRFGSVTQGNPYYSNKQFYFYINQYEYTDGVHWGYANIRGQLGGYDDLGSTMITKPEKTDTPLITDDIIRFYNEIEKMLSNYDIFFYDDRIKKSYKINTYIIDKQIFIDTIFNNLNKFTFILNNTVNVQTISDIAIKYFIVSYSKNFESKISDESMQNEIKKYEFKTK